jgi:uncharacterized protein YqfA (UPF0365 family)
MIEAELSRIERIKQAEQAKAEAAARAAEEAAKRREAEAVAKAEAEARAKFEAEQAKELHEETETVDQPPQPAEAPVSSGEITIQATFKVKPPSGVTPEQILAAFKKRLSENGFEKSFAGAVIL